MKLSAILLAGVGCLLLLPGRAPAQENPKHAADEVIRWIDARQNPDGTYGRSLAETCRVLDLLGRAPRRYTELDGPFYRVPAQRVAAAPAGEVPDALVALGLAAAITKPLQDRRDAAIAAVRAQPPGQDWDRWLVLRTFPADPAPAPVELDPQADPGLACLLAANPATVAAPPVTDVPAWTRWARAARLRGLTPSVIPPLPALNETATLAELTATLETLIQMHGLYQPPVFRVDDDDTGAGDDANAPAIAATGRTFEQVLPQALAFLDRHQHGGTFSLEIQGWDEPDPGVTAMCLSAAMAGADALHQPRPAWLAPGLDFLVSKQRKDGSIQEQGLAVYTTSVALEALVAGGRAQDAPAIAKARDFLVAGQFDESDGYDQHQDPYYGGVGYGDGQRPDLSNSQMAIEAVARAGLPAGDAFFRKAIVFLQRCQNYAESGPQSWPRAEGGVSEPGNDGGGVYLPGVSAAGEVRVGEGVYQPRSYGSMTYALAKSYILCGAPVSDAHRAAAIRWLAQHFSVDENPGFENADEGRQGLYYYYLALARTLRRLPADGFRDEAGKPIAWREALTRKLLDNQRLDGSWINTGSVRWFEGAPTLCTAYAVLALTDAHS